MHKKKFHYYLIHIQYLGFRYHGWAKQPAVKTVHHMIDRTLSFVLDDVKFKTLGSSRTDAMVSANSTAFELFIKQPLNKEFLDEFNKNLPFDIRALSIEEVDEKFNIIQAPKTKEYVYLFCFGPKPHPFSAPLLAWFPETLDLEAMKEGAILFEGKHNFKNYCKKPSEKTKTEREVIFSQIEENDVYQANFFPEKTYGYHVHGTGFMRNQIRAMMGALVELGRGKFNLDNISDSLNNPAYQQALHVAPASGLHLSKVQIDLQ